MVQYKLVYFNGRGLAEASRQLFHLARVPFEDHRLTEKEFEHLKPTLPTGQVPILYIDGLEYSQSTAIARYLARKFGFSGKTPEEELLADGIVDTFKDWINSFKLLAEVILFGKTPEDVMKVREEVAKPAANVYFSYLNKILAKNSSGFLVGDSLTWADLVVADNLTSCLNTEVLDESEEPRLAEFRRTILKTEELKDYFEKRPVTTL
ncbi:unnamed protein product [Caenorhabditis sp. 36 PRJEB53466]|nr:unnamed protein product [Caenorhabditis sp. 36 PRJEB53466]